MTAEIVYDPRGISKQVVFVAGDTVSYKDVADLVEKRFGGEWKRELWDLPTLNQRLKDNPQDGMVKYQNVFGAGKGVAWDILSKKEHFIAILKKILTLETLRESVA